MMDSDSAWDDAFHDLWLHTVRHRGLLTSLAELPGPMRGNTDAVLAPGSPLTHHDHEYTAALAVAPGLEQVPATALLVVAAMAAPGPMPSAPKGPESRKWPGA